MYILRCIMYLLSAGSYESPAVCWITGPCRCHRPRMGGGTGGGLGDYILLRLDYVLM